MRASVRMIGMFSLLVCMATGGPVSGREPDASSVPAGALARLAVKEVTVFKDGHAFVLHEGEVPVAAGGAVHLDHLPTPVMGTFWPYSADPAVKLNAVVAGKQPVNVERNAVNVRQLLAANVGAKVLIHDGQRSYAATIVDLPVRKPTNAADATSAGQGAGAAAAEVIVLKTEEGYKVIGVDSLATVTFLEQPKRTLAKEETRNVLELRLGRPAGDVRRTAKIGMMYLQKGLRWIPNYRVTIDGKGSATVKLQATLLNDLTDLADVTAHLVVGVPNFYFEATIDPMALGETVSQLSQYFQQGSPTSYGLSNAMMTQVARMSEHRVPIAEAPPADVGADITNAGKREDLYVFTVKNITLKRGERMVLPVVEFPLAYTDVYRLEIPFSPPPEIRRQFNNQQQAELARLFGAPKVMHHIRLANNSQYPLTTAPAMILQDGRLLGQGLMTYAAAGASTDLAITTAVDVAVMKSDTETKRTASAAVWGGNQYDRVDLSGRIVLTNYRGTAAEVEIERTVLGNATESSHGAAVEKLNMREEAWQIDRGYPLWWNWYSWPYWWDYLNGVSRIKWRVQLQPAESLELSYQWHYFWRG